MAKAKDVSAPILTGTAGTESALTGIDQQSKAAFENALRAAGMDQAVEQFVQENPESFLSPKESFQLEQLGPEKFWPKYYGTSQSDVTSNAASTGFDSLIPQTNNGSPFSYSDYMDDGWLVAHYADGSTKYIMQDPSKSKSGLGKTGNLTASDGTKFSNYQDYLTYQASLDSKKQERQSAYDLLYSQFKQYGLESLVDPLKALITDAKVSPSEFAIKLQETPAYQQRFAANKDRIAKGLTALTPAQYLAMEDQYQNIMRNYGLPDSYWKPGTMGTQEGFNKLLANDVSATELEDRVLNAQNRVLNANPEVVQALKNFYPNIKNGDILAYVLDPQNALTNIKRKITASEIGGAAYQAGLATSAQRAEELAAAGVTGQEYQQASPFLVSAAERGSQLSDIYKMDQYGQTQAEQEAFKLAGGTEAAARRRKLTELEKAQFSGSSGALQESPYRNIQGAIKRERAGSI